MTLKQFFIVTQSLNLTQSLALNQISSQFWFTGEPQKHLSYHRGGKGTVRGRCAPFDDSDVILTVKQQ